MNITTPKNKTEFDALTSDAKLAADAYYNGGESHMSDEKYDAIVDSLADAVREHPEWSTEVVDGLISSVAGGLSVNTENVIVHSVPMLSLSKTTEVDGVRRFVERTPSANYVVEPKVDGIACAARYKDGERVLIATRGDGMQGEDITDRIDSINVNFFPKRIDYEGDIEVRGELYMSTEDFEFSNKKRTESGKPAFANPRNATSGIVMRETVTHDARLSFALYEVLGANVSKVDSYTNRINNASYWGFMPANLLLPSELQQKFASAEDVVNAVTKIGELRTTGEIQAPTDGCVIKIDSTQIRDELGHGSRHPHWAVAFKYDALRGTTTLLDIERDIGRTGNISYTAILSPVFIDGSTVTRATLHNADYIRERDLRIGDTVVVYKANDIIPRVDSQVTPENIERSDAYVAPTTCPKCAGELDRSGAIWRCETPSCGIINLVTYAVSRDALDVDGFSSAIATALVENGHISTLADTFAVNYETLKSLPMGQTSKGNTRILGESVATKVYNGLQKAKQQPLARVITALGIKMTGRGMSRRLAATFGDIDAILNATHEDFMNSGIDAVGPTRADAFVKGFALMRDDVERMREMGFTMTHPTQEKTLVSDNPLTGKKVVITGSVPGQTRTGAQEAAESLGATVSSSVSKTVQIVIVGDGAGSKAKKAQELGIEIMNAEDFATLIAQNS